MLLTDTEVRTRPWQSGNYSGRASYIVALRPFNTTFAQSATVSIPFDSSLGPAFKVFKTLKPQTPKP